MQHQQHLLIVCSKWQMVMCVSAARRLREQHHLMVFAWSEFSFLASQCPFGISTSGMVCKVEWSQAAQAARVAGQAYSTRNRSSPMLCSLGSTPCLPVCNSNSLPDLRDLSCPADAVANHVAECSPASSRLKFFACVKDSQVSIFSRDTMLRWC